MSGFLLPPLPANVTGFVKVKESRDSQMYVYGGLNECYDEEELDPDGVQITIRYAGGSWTVYAFMSLNFQKMHTMHDIRLFLVSDENLAAEIARARRYGEELRRVVEVIERWS